MRLYPFWWVAMALCVALPVAATPKPVGLRAGESAPYTGVLVAPDDARRCAACAIDLSAARRDIDECRRREAVPLPVACTPVVVRVDKPVPVVVERTWWLPVAVGVVVGFVGGAVAAWRLMR